jgi:pimeloyl-ACP methyl ester carboxylesterase
LPSSSAAPHIIDFNRPVGYHRFHPDESLNFQCNRWLQWIGPEAFDEIAATAIRIKNYDDWIDAFLDLASRARDEGRMVPAAYYDRSAEFFIPAGDPRKKPARQRFVSDMRLAYGMERHLSAVPYENGSLPAYDIGPDSTPSGTVVFFGGFDSYIEEFFPLIGAMEGAGYRVVAFDGPGQGGALEESGLSLTAAWERPVSAVLDYYRLDDVTLIGVSLGGGLAIRAAAFEPRVRRVVADDVLDDFLECMGRQIAPGATPVLRLGLVLGVSSIVNGLAGYVSARKPVTTWGLQQGMHVTGTRTPFDYLLAARALNTRRVSGMVKADVLLLAGAKDHYIPLHQLYRQARALTAARSVATRLFTEEEQAQNHCQVGNVGASMRTILSWIESLG